MPDDGRDDTAAIQRALDSLAPDEWLVFPPGRYLHDRRLRVTVPGTKLWGRGAQLHATNPEDQAVMLMADRASIYGFTLTADTDKRGNKPWQARIAVHPRAGETLVGNEIRGNRIVADTAHDPRAQNGAAASGIFIYRARDFLVAENEVERTLADGIHVTAGSSEGRVLANVVRETGDDMIAIVSYLGRRGEPAGEVAAKLDERLADAVVHDVLIAGNDLDGQYWGRGISVVGGRDITVRDNTIRDATMAAAIYIAREAGYVTAGVRNVLIENNRIEHVQTTEPRYVAPSAPRGRRRTGHAAIEVVAQVDDDEARVPALAQALRISGVRIARNTVQDAASGGIRVEQRGERHGARAAWRGARDEDEDESAALVRGVTLVDNRIGGTRGPPIDVPGRGARPSVACQGNTAEGRAAGNGACRAREEPVTGAALPCLQPGVRN